MRAGRMNRKITIQQPTETLDSYNQPVASWSTYKTVWAEYLPKRGREYFAADQTVAEADAVFRIRYDSGVTRKMRISFGGDYYDISGISEIGYKEGLEIAAQAVVE